MIDGLQFDENGKMLSAKPGQRHWDGWRWITIARVDVIVDMIDDHVELTSASLDGELITERELINVMNFRAQGATSKMLDRALAEIYFGNKAVAYC